MSENQKIIVDACCHVKDAHIKGRPIIGKSACGVIIINSNGEEFEFSKYLGEKTPPQAEFEGLVFALDKASEVLNRNKNIDVWMDSELVIKWMNKEYKLHQDHIKPIYDEANLKAQRFINVQYFHHPRTTQHAQRADKLAKAEFDKYNK